MSDFHFITPIIDQEYTSSPSYYDNKSFHQIKTPQRCKFTETQSGEFSINESILNETERTPSKLHLLSPDLAGAIFPVEFKANTPKLNLYTATNLHRSISEIIFDGNIEPSPEYDDSGIGISTNSFYTDNFSLMRSLSVPCTPPSNFKWNRKEFRSNQYKESTEIFDLSEDENDSDSISFYRNNLQSTKLFDNSYKLADNSSMMQFSSISNDFSRNSNKSFVVERKTILKSFNVSNNSDISPSGELSALSYENIDSNSEARKLKQSPYYRSSPRKKSNKDHVHFNLNSPISPIIRKFSRPSLKKQISSDARLNTEKIFDDIFEHPISSRQFNCCPISDISPILGPSNSDNGSLSNSFVPCMADLDISPIQSDNDELDMLNY